MGASMKFLLLSISLYLAIIGKYLIEFFTGFGLYILFLIPFS